MKPDHAPAPSLEKATPDEPCSMAAHPFLKHGATGHCEIRNEPCPRSCLLKTIHRLDLEVESLTTRIKLMQGVATAGGEDWPECEEFFNLMQTYRHSLIEDQGETNRAYEDVKDWLRKHHAGGQKG